jgi:small GTP-binding protein
MQIWDTAGQERFRTLTKNYYRDAHGIAIVYDVTKKASFDNVLDWIQEISQKAPENCIKVLIANKIDMINLRVVKEDEGKDLAGKYSLNYFETSAKNENGVYEAFDFMAVKIISFLKVSASYLSHSHASIILKSKKKEVKKSSCC